MNAYLLAPAVIASRMPLLWLEMMGQQGPGRRESERMVTEKLTAFQLGMFAAQAEMLRAGFAMGTAVMAGASPAGAALRGARAVQAAAEQPMEEAMRANLKRLSQGA